MIANKSFKNVTKLKYLGMILTFKYNADLSRYTDVDS